MSLASILADLVKCSAAIFPFFDDISDVLVLQFRRVFIRAHCLGERRVGHVRHTSRPLAKQEHGQ